MENNEENKNNEKISIDTEELRSETASTIEGVKESIKNVDIKKDTEETKNLLTDLFKNPVNKMKSIAKSENKLLKIAIILIVIWTIAVFTKAVYTNISFSYFTFAKLFRNMLAILKSTIAPILGIIAMSVTAFVMNKDKKKKLATIISTVTIARVPMIAAAIFSLLTIVSSNISSLTSSFTSFCRILSAILLYFGFKGIFEEEEDNNFVKKFVLIIGIYYIADFILSFLGISI